MERGYIDAEQFTGVDHEDFRFPSTEAEINRESERLQKFQELAIEFFSLHGIVQVEQGNTVVDTNALKSLTDSILTYSDTKGYRYFERSGKTAPKEVRARLKKLAATFHHEYADLSDGYLSNFLINAFHGKEAVGSEEWGEWKKNSEQTKKPEAKAVFYEPPDETEAFDVVAIKESQFHIGVWEIPGDKPDYYSPRTPVLDYNEVSLAALIYHPDYGDGVRNESGELEVTDKNGARRKLAMDWFERQTYSTMGPQKHTEGSFFRSPKLALREGRFPHLTESGLLQPEDFASVSGSEVAKKFGQERKLGQAGTVTIDGVRYTLGREFDDGNYWAYKISDTLGGVLETDKNGNPHRLTHVFDLVKENDPRLVSDKTTGHLLFGKKSGLRVIPYNEGAREVFFRRKSDETTEEFGERSREANDFVDIVKAKHDVVRQTGVSLEDLSSREQYQFLSFYRSSEPEEKDEVYDFVKKFGRDGMRAFLALEADPQLGDTILNIGEQGARPDVKKLFTDYASIITFAENFGGSIIPQIKQEVGTQFDEREFIWKLSERAAHFLRYCAEVMRADGTLTYDKVRDRIKKERPALNLQSCYEGVVSAAVIEMVNIVGDVQARAVLDAAYQGDVSPAVKKNIELAYNFITPVTTDKEAIRDLRDLYEKIQFEKYHVNEAMNEKELQWLLSHVGASDKILDSGCGTGRLLNPLLEKGFDVSGLDYTQRHVDIIKNAHPKANVKQGDWKKTGFRDEEFTVVYSLGRNILHETQLPGQESLFEETARLLPVGGKFIFDIPDTGKGGYKDMADGYARVMTEREIHHFRYGTIYDSPDGKNFMTRYAYSHDDIAKLAEDNGFVIESVEEKPLATGRGDVNMYYVLRKVRSVHRLPESVIEDGALKAA